MKTRYLIIFTSITMLVSNYNLVSCATPKINSEQVVNGAPKPKSGIKGVANRGSKLAGSGARVAGSMVAGATKGAAKEAVKGAVTGAIGGAITGPSVAAGAVAGAAGGVVVGVGTGSYDGCKKGIDAAKYPNK